MLTGGRAQAVMRAMGSGWNATEGWDCLLYPVKQIAYKEDWSLRLSRSSCPTLMETPRLFLLWMRLQRRPLGGKLWHRILRVPGYSEPLRLLWLNSEVGQGDRCRAPGTSAQSYYMFAFWYNPSQSPLENSWGEKKRRHTHTHTHTVVTFKYTLQAFPYFGSTGLSLKL